MRECQHCGKQVAFKSETCPACGGPLDGDSDLVDHEDGDDLNETRPFHPSFDALQQPAKELKDTVERLPAIDMEITDEATDEELLRATFVDSPPADEFTDDLPETVDVPHPPVKMELDLTDTLVEVEPADERPGPITFSELDSAARVRAVSTGAKPLDFQHFARGREVMRPNAEVGDAVDDAPGAPRAAPPQPRGCTRLTKVLAFLAALCWVGVAGLMVTTFLQLPLVLRLLSALPFSPELLVALPGLLLLLTLLAATAAELRARAALRPASRTGIFLGRLGWFLLAALPAIGLVGGLAGALYLIIRRRPNLDPDSSASYAADGPGATDRPVGWTLLFFTLAWQDIAAVIVLTHFRAHVPWL